MRSSFTTFRNLVYLVLALATCADAHCQTLHWVKQLGSDNADEGTAITISQNGNVYSGGNFKDTMDIDPGPAAVNLIAQGQGDAFISRLDTSGNFIWTKQITGTGSEYCNGIAADVNGDVYIAGTFLGSTDFDPGPGTFILTSSPSLEAFICKLDASGNFIWAKKFGPNTSSPFQPQPVYTNGIAVDDAGNVYITGSFDGPTDFDPGSATYALAPIQLGGGYTSDIYVTKLTASGNFIWARQLGGTHFEAAHAIAVDGSGNVFTTGFFNGTVDFDPGAGVFNLNGPSFSTGLTDFFISKLNASGNFAWAKQMGGGRGYAIDVDNVGNVYASGEFPHDSIIVYKLNPSGTTIWSKQLGASDCSSLVVDDINNVLITGTFHGTRDFDPGPGTFNITAFGGGASYISKLDSAGNFFWAKQLGGTQQLTVRSLTVDGKDNVYTTGFFQSTADFDPELTTFNLTSTGSLDIFMHKMRPVTISAGVGGTSSDDGFAIYPNPTNGKFIIEFDRADIDCELILRNIVGQVVDNRSVSTAKRVQLEINQASGIYSLEVRYRHGRRAVVRIVKY